MDKSNAVSIIPVISIYCVLALFMPLGNGSGLPSQDATAEIDHTRIADYDIEVTLDGSKKTLSGRETINWVNAGGVAASELKLHLYMNAFRSPDTAFFEFRDNWKSDEAGWIDIKSVSLSGGRDLTDVAAIDETVMTIPLPEPIEPGQRAILDIEFEVQLPKIFARTGYSDNYYLVAQWFPKMGVFLDGRWVCPQFYSFTEFFADYGQYRVEITAPKKYIVGATGVLERTRTRGDMKTHVFTASPVHDFAWTASPDFRLVKSAITFDYQGEQKQLDLHLLIQRDRVDQAPAYERAVRKVVTSFAKDYGLYPYSKLTVVDPGPGRGQNSGGMEYPMFITGGGGWVNTYLFPGGLQPEGVTIHEFGHQYWYGVVGNNEFDEAWLDEGINSYTSDKVIDEIGSNRRNTYFSKVFVEHWVRLHPFAWDFDFDFGGLSPLLTMGLEINRNARRRLSYLQDPALDPINNPGYRAFDGSGYRNSAYNKPKLGLASLENIIGEQTVKRIMSRFFDTYKFRHPTGADFRALASEVAGEDLSWYFDQVWDGTGVIDYAVTGVTGKSDDSENENQSEITVQRLGTVILPQTVRVHFDDGTHVDFEWDRKGVSGERIWMDQFAVREEDQSILYRIREGKLGKWFKLALRTEKNIVSAEVDPGYGYQLDINFANNSWVVEPDGTFASRGELSWVRLLGRWLHGVSSYN